MWKPQSRRGRRGPSLRVPWALAIALGIGVFAVSDFAPREAFGFLHPAEPAAQERPVSLVAIARPMPICGGGKRISCIVDGDTFWTSGEKVRLEGIDAPEVNGRCGHERQLAQRATKRLSEILSRQGFTLHRNGVDRYGRTLARVQTPQGEAGAILVREGLARPWRGRKEQWCA